jgi:PAS domain S-box-containing protein
VFETAGHCVHALGEVHDPAEHRDLVRLILDAAARAVAVNAAVAADGYCRAVLGHLDPADDGHRDLLFDARKLLGESQILRGEFDSALQTFDEALSGPVPMLGRVALLTLKMEMWVSQGRIDAALSTLIDILSAFGIAIDADKISTLAASASDDIVRARGRRTLQEVVQGEEATDPAVIALLDVLARAADTAYMSGRDWSVATAALGITTVLEHGVTVAAAMVFSNYAVADGEPTTPEGFARRAEYGRIGSAIADRYGIAAWIARANVANPPHFDRSFVEAVARFDLAAATGWESSALTWAAYAEVRSLFTMLVAGVPLGHLHTERQQRVARIRRARRSVSEVCCDALELFVRELRTPTGDGSGWSPDGHTGPVTPAEVADLDARVARSGPWAACKVLTLRQLLAVVYGRWEQAEAVAAAMAPIAHAVHGMTHEHWFHLFEGMRLANTLGSRPESARAQARVRAQTLIGFLEARIALSPDHGPSLHMARAVLARIERDPRRSVNEHNRAMEEARSLEQLPLLALSAEEAFRVATEEGWGTLARFYLQEAHSAYAAWGATAKARELTEQFPSYFYAPSVAADALAVADVESLFKSVRAISGELRIGDLLRRLMQIVLENAGAQRGLIVLEREGGHVVEVVGSVQGQSIETDLPGSPLDPSQVAFGLIQSVFRSGETLVLDDLEGESRFGLAKVPAAERPRSTLIMAIESQGRHIGAMHLESWSTKYAFRADARRALWLLLSQAVTAIENARLYGSIEREIEERTRTEMALRAERDYTANVFETLPLLACGVDSDGMIVFVNPAVVRMLRWTASDLVGRSWWLTMHDRADERQALKDRFAHADQLREVRDHESTLRDADGHEHVVSWTCVPSRDGGRHRSEMLCFGADVTVERQRARDRKVFDDQLQRDQQLETVGTLALGIAHDINNILTPVAVYADLLKDSVPVDSEAHSFVTEIQSASMRAADLVHRVLAASRRGESASHTTMLGHIVQEVCRLLSASLGSRIEVRTQIDPDCPAVLVDPGQVHQALLNLGTNAGHAMRANGGLLTMTVRCSTFPAASSRPGEACVVVSVSDTGNGMDADTAARIFEPFFTTKAAGEGTGLGLWVGHGVAKNAGGHVTVHSAVGEGTTFDMFFPIQEVRTPLMADRVVARKERAKGERATTCAGGRRRTLDPSPPRAGAGAAWLPGHCRRACHRGARGVSAESPRFRSRAHGSEHAGTRRDRSGG